MLRKEKGDKDGREGKRRVNREKTDNRREGVRKRYRVNERKGR